MAPPKRLDEVQLRKEFAEGHSYREIARRLGVHQSTVAHAVRRLNLPRRLTRLDDIRTQSAAIAEAYRQGASLAALSQSYGADRRTVRALLHDLGFETPLGAKGALNYQWRDGRITTTAGYIKVRLASDNHYISMADKGGYVLEHRLVMAEHHARSLRSTETVHHINGDRADNRIENLQLRQGKHGAGLVMCCGDCGSLNLQPCELE